ncbi:hypothetical protein CEP54_015839 [Fusarium duplospermum]|uniref:Uncharacterized protein n=1 Tax=Fusarium duplospermum TaxID=1325734 RepID=A0A428NL28_9HYPO|nr:hypothetical protein CEP54_015839 [Fusarium duplospermum]
MSAREKRSNPTPPEDGGFISTILELIDLLARLSRIGISLARMPTVFIGVSKLDNMKKRARCNFLARLWNLGSGWLRFSALSTAVGPVSPSVTLSGYQKHGLVGFFWMWWVWRHSTAWILGRIILRQGDITWFLGTQHTTTLILAAIVVGSTVVNYSVLFGLLGWVICGGMLASPPIPSLSTIYTSIHQALKLEDNRDEGL